MPTTLVNGLGGPSGFGEAFIPRNDDIYTDLIDVRSVFPGGLNFFGTVYTGLYINNNGSVTFTNGISQYTPTAITGITSNPIIAPYWADVDTRLAGQSATDVHAGTVTPTPGGSSTGSDLVWYDLDSVGHTLTVTWDDVGYYAAHPDKLNAFQLRLRAVPANGVYAGDFNIEFRYEAIAWVAGDASGGTTGLGGTAARIGYSSGNGTDYVELPQSGNEAALLDIATTGNTGVPGFFEFDVRNGAPTPAISIGDVSVAEGNIAGQAYAAVPVTLAAQSATAITVGYMTVGGSATPGADYTAQRGTVTFAPGTLQQTILIPITSDQAAEPDERFTVHLGDAVGAPIAAADGTVTILNDDGLTVADVSGLEGAGPLVFTVRLLSASAQTVSVGYQVTSGTPILVGTLSFAPGETSRTVSVPVADDPVLGPDRTLLFQLLNPVNAPIARGTATGTILNDDGLVIDDLSVAEGAGTANVTVRLQRALATPVAATYTTAPGTASAGADYTPVTGTVTIPAGSTSATIPIPIAADASVEANETFTVSLSGAAIARGAATVTIIDDDGFAVNDVTVLEGTGGTSSAVFTVTLQSALATTTTVAYATSPGTAAPGTDFTPVSGTLTFAPGATSQTVSIPILADATPEPDETLFLTLANPAGGAGLFRATGQATIVNDDGLSIGDGTVTEGNAGTRSVVLPVSLASAAAQPVTVGWATADGTATAGSDYTAGSGTLTFAPGETSKTISVAVNGDTAFEPNETFRVVLSNPTSSAIVKGSGTVVIVDDDTRPLPALSIAPVAVTEGGAGGNAVLGFQVGLSYAATATVTVRYATRDGTATAGSDYTATNGTLTIPAGSLSGIIAVPLLGDSTIEPDETLTLTLSSPSANATIAAAAATGTLLNDDSSFSIAAPSARAEANGGVTDFSFTVSRAGYAGEAQSVTLTPSGAGSSPVDAADLVGGFTPIVVGFAPNETAKTVTIGIRGDTAAEGDETLRATLSAPTGGATIATASAETTVLNDDALPNFDAVYYLSTYADLRAAFGTDAAAALRHYVTTGWKEGRNPSATFDTTYYLTRYPDVRSAGAEPLAHFDRVGWAEGRNPDAFFDTRYYLTLNPDVKAAGVNPLTHFDTVGWREGRQPSLAFSDSAYLAANPDVAAAGFNPLQHYLQSGRIEGRPAIVNGPVKDGTPGTILVDDAYAINQVATIRPPTLDGAKWFHQTGWKWGVNPNPWFDTTYYLTQNPDVKAAGLDPLAHFESNGWHEGRDPSLLFSGAKYLAAYADVKAAGLDPLAHYVFNGRAEGRMSFLTGGTAPADPLVDAAYYDRQLGATLIPTGPAAAQQAASSYATTGWQRGLNPDELFDTAYYLAHNPDVAAAHINPLAHYEINGWHEGRDPSAQFSTSKYLAAYADVRAADFNPLLHYVNSGQAEGRTAFPV